MYNCIFTVPVPYAYVILERNVYGHITLSLCPPIDKDPTSRDQETSCDVSCC